MLVAIQCDHFTLGIACGTAIEKVRRMKESEFEEKSLQLIKAVKDEFPAKENRVKTHKAVAKHNGITVKALIASPNYEILCEEYERAGILKFIELQKEIFGFDDLEAWAVLVKTNGSTVNT